LGFNGAGEIGAADRHPVAGQRRTIAGATKRVDGSSTGRLGSQSAARRRVKRMHHEAR